MNRITVVCSVHRENGRCNVAELLNILNSIGPDVIFEEFRPAEFDVHLKQGILEALAINRYRASKSVQQVSVDQYELPKGFRAELDNVMDYVERVSQEYRELYELNRMDSFHHGFAYLNSPVCEKILLRLSKIEDEIVFNSRNQEFIRVLEMWRRLTQIRESDMVNAIYGYAREHAFTMGVFMVGAAHKFGIRTKIEENAKSEADLIKWSHF